MHVVAFGAFALLGTIVELALVGIRLMAIVAESVIQGLLEITVKVAGNAGNLLVFAFKRILGLGMIKVKSGKN